MASAHRCPSHPKSMMQSLHVLRCTLRGSLLPLHLEQRLCRPVGASEQESVASRCATAAAAFVATHSFNGWRCCPIPPLYKVLLRQRLLAPFYTASKRVTIIGFCPTERCTRIIRLSAERIYRQWNTSANILRYALHGGQRHGSTSSDRSGSEQEIVPTP